MKSVSVEMKVQETRKCMQHSKEYKFLKNRISKNSDV